MRENEKVVYRELSYNERIAFYVGYELLNSNEKPIGKEKEKMKTYKWLSENDNVNENERINYKEEFKKLVEKTNNIDKIFYLATGDIQHKEGKYTIAKNRWRGNQNSVILRCLEFHRHWANVYEKQCDIPFERKMNKIFWRGDPSGGPLWKQRVANRFDLVERWCNKTDNIDVGLSRIYHESLLPYFKGHCPIKTFLKHKYIISVEGNDKDTGLNWKLNSNSLVMMPRPRVTSWLMETTLIPDYHYIIIKDDYSDLEERFEYCKKNPKKCKEIIRNANNFMSQFKDVAKEEQLEMDVINIYFSLVN